jgi:hypothetical protein
MFTLARLDRTGVVLERLGDLDALVREATRAIEGGPIPAFDQSSWQVRAGGLARMLAAGADLVTIWQACERTGS